jgi:hypothetical protein
MTVRREVLKLKLLIHALFLVFIGCVAPKPAPRIIGEWETDKIMSQLGESVIYHQFNKNGTFILRQSFIQAHQTLTSQGNFKTEGNQLILVSTEKTSKQTFIFEGDKLLINDGDDTFRFKRKI